MDRIKKIKIKKSDGTFTDYLPLGSDAEYIDLENGNNLQEEINHITKSYDNVAAMKADINIKEGDICQTLGYYEVNDGGGAEYKITSNAIADNYSIHQLNNNLFAELIIKEALYSRQVGVSDILDDNSLPLNHFLLKAASIGKSYLQKGSYKITSPLTLYLSSSINIDGKVTILDYIAENTTTINVTKLNNDSDSGGRPYANTILGADNGCLILSNQMSYETYNNKIGIALGSSDYNTNGIIKNVRINGRYAEGMKISPTNVWWLQLQDMGFSGAEIGLHIDDTGNHNAGEMIVLDHCCWTRCNCSVRMDSYFNMLYTHCAWDFVSCAFYCTEIAEIVCDKCHFEGIGNRWNNDITTYNGFGGIFKARDTLLNYQQTRLTISNSHILSPYMENFTNKFFAGQSLYVNLVNNAFYTFPYYNEMCAKDDNFTYAWSSDESVRQVRIVNCHGEQNGYYQNFMLIKDNKIDGWLEDEDITEEISVTSSTAQKNAVILNMNNFEIVGTGRIHTNTKIQILPLTQESGETKKMIKIIPYVGGQSHIILRPKKKFALDTLPKIFTIGYTKGELRERHLRIDISFFDENDQYISTRTNITSNYGTMNNEHWFTQVRDQYTNVNNQFTSWIIPNNASYYKVDFYMFATNNADAITPAYYTGFYINHQE